MLGNCDGTHRHAQRSSRRLTAQVTGARTVLGENQLPTIRLHDLRHTHAALLLADGVPVKVVSERLGNANATITLTVYQHVHPGMGRRRPTASPSGFGAEMVREVSNDCHEADPAPTWVRPGLRTCRNTGAMLCPKADSLHAHTTRRLEMSRHLVCEGGRGRRDVGAVPPEVFGAKERGVRGFVVVVGT
ncbi:Phage integrase family protein [Geodermatophilus amargosae]|uniref:Phage integrase family protein n=1 Tax=Geodermatophilus amargosae TaxID=1296565 RepID=A0A1I7BHS7_9ACTN|nr:tyrosine-type recombinase/integrase [Geodermatophilus amargosae]SFT86712.1 Phage integrase family protein [Geodermatophilus amargosae]